MVESILNLIFSAPKDTLFHSQIVVILICVINHCWFEHRSCSAFLNARNKQECIHHNTAIWHCETWTPWYQALLITNSLCGLVLHHRAWRCNGEGSAASDDGIAWRRNSSERTMCIDTTSCHLKNKRCIPIAFHTGSNKIVTCHSWRFGPSCRPTKSKLIQKFEQFQCHTLPWTSCDKSWKKGSTVHGQTSRPVVYRTHVWIVSKLFCRRHHNICNFFFPLSFCCIHVLTWSSGAHFEAKSSEFSQKNSQLSCDWVHAMVLAFSLEQEKQVKIMYIPEQETRVVLSPPHPTPAHATAIEDHVAEHEDQRKIL